MTKTTGVILAIIVVGIAVTTRSGSHDAGQVCPATSSGQVASTGGSAGGR